MIERKFLKQRMKEIEVQNYVAASLARSGHSKVDIRHTPLGDRIIIYSVRPGMIVGRKGENIKMLTSALRNKFGLENPQIEMGSVENPMLDANSVADRISYSLEKFGPKKFKFLGYETLKQIMNAGAIGAEIVISGVGVPGARAKSWRFSAGYMKKSGDVSASQVLRSTTVANLRRGTIGIKVAIIPPDVVLPDKVWAKEIKEEKKEETIVEEIKEEKKKEEKEKKKKPSKRKKEAENGDNKKE
ncbi:30S ribosomal protein S3 [Candidatus Woesearchaeota archaeon]|nr:30S ribosomal protein S3 [Candidatus Woesearchaeota archaeon]